MKSNLICGRGASGGSYIVPQDPGQFLHMLHTNVDEIGSQSDHRPIFSADGMGRW